MSKFKIGEKVIYSSVEFVVRDIHDNGCYIIHCKQHGYIDNIAENKLSKAKSRIHNASRYKLALYEVFDNEDQILEILNIFELYSFWKHLCSIEIFTYKFSYHDDLIVLDKDCPKIIELFSEFKTSYNEIQ